MYIIGPRSPYLHQCDLRSVLTFILVEYSISRRHRPLRHKSLTRTSLSLSLSVCLSLRTSSSDPLLKYEDHEAELEDDVREARRLADAEMASTTATITTTIDEKTNGVGEGAAAAAAASDASVAVTTTDPPVAGVAPSVPRGLEWDLSKLRPGSNA